MNTSDIEKIVQDVQNNFKDHWLCKYNFVEFTHNLHGDSELIDVFKFEEGEIYGRSYRSVMESVMENTQNMIFEYIVKTIGDSSDVESLIEYCLPFELDDHIILFHFTQVSKVKKACLSNKIYDNIKMQCYASKKTLSAVALRLLKASVPTYKCTLIFVPMAETFYLRIQKTK